MPRAHQVGFSIRSLAGVGVSEIVRCHGPGLALMTNGSVQQQQRIISADCHCTAFNYSLSYSISLPPLNVCIHSLSWFQQKLKDNAYTLTKTQKRFFVWGESSNI
ncbi:hypothetical protein TNCV_4756211 [Trichonephila clavipes]|nr:hypothetical protein TNCV_4756211 [Trichonephila clavipes]